MTHMANLVLVPREFLEFLKNAQVGSGVCCCGQMMDDHQSDHYPVDQWQYSLSQWLKEIETLNTGQGQ